MGSGQITVAVSGNRNCGVRSVLMPQPVPAVTTVDLGLSWVIFILLFGLTLRGDGLQPGQ